MVGNDALGVFFAAVRSPAPTAVTDYHRHGGVDDDVAGYVEVGNSLVGIDHIHFRLLIHAGLQVGPDLGLLIGGQGLNLGFYVADAVVGVDAEFGEGIGMFFIDLLEEHRNRVTEDDGVGNLHHGGLHVQ